MLHFRIATYAYMASALSGSLVIYLFGRPASRSMLGMLFLAASFFAIYGLLAGDTPLSSFPAFCGLGSLAALALTALWSPRATERQASLDTCLTAFLFPLFLAIAGFSLAVTTAAHPMTYDFFLYAFDEQLNCQPSFLAGQLLDRSHFLQQACILGYESLPLAMALAFALERRRPARDHPSTLPAAFAVAAAGGFLLYNLYPAVGPVHVFPTQFPYSPPPAGSPPFRLLAAGPEARNAMPSVHIAMALLILWTSRAWPAVLRVFAAALLAVTVLATLGLGEHYLVDLVVAVPFAALAQSLGAANVPWRNATRMVCVSFTALSVLVCLIYLRQALPPLGGRGAWAWSLLLACGGASLILESRLHRIGTAAP